MNLEQRVAHVEERIRAACARSGRPREDVRLIAVTKYVSLETTRRLMELGCSHIGENRWQDAAGKWEALQGAGTWHFLGTLQTNKVKDVVGKFAYIHSLDRLSLAKEIEKRAARQGIRVDCFIQVNVSGEQTKHGIAPDELPDFAREVSNCEHLRVVGLMTMAPHVEDAEQTRPVFRELRRLRDDLNEAGIFKEAVPHLSMGMSNDFEVAIEEGATWIRLGSVLTGTTAGR